MAKIIFRQFPLTFLSLASWKKPFKINEKNISKLLIKYGIKRHFGTG
jgi:hypothetical protein